VDVTEARPVVDADLDRLISRRASTDRRPDPDALEPSYRESVRRFNAAREAERREAWSLYHREQAGRLRRTLEDLIANHETRAARLCESEPTKGA
jgi:hypothetical protein